MNSYSRDLFQNGIPEFTWRDSGKQLVQTKRQAEGKAKALTMALDDAKSVAILHDSRLQKDFKQCAKRCYATSSELSPLAWVQMFVHVATLYYYVMLPPH